MIEGATQQGRHFRDALPLIADVAQTFIPGTTREQYVAMSWEKAALVDRPEHLPSKSSQVHGLSPSSQDKPLALEVGAYTPTVYKEDEISKIWSDAVNLEAMVVITPRTHQGDMFAASTYGTLEARASNPTLLSSQNNLFDLPVKSKSSSMFDATIHPSLATLPENVVCTASDDFVPANKKAKDAASDPCFGDYDGCVLQ